MNDSIGVTPMRCVTVLLSASLAVAGALAVLLPDLVTADPRAAMPPEVALVLLAEAALAGCAVWAWLVVLAVTLEALRGSTTTTPGVPRCARRLVLTACGAALVGASIPGTAAGAPPEASGCPEPPAPALTVVGPAAPRVGVALQVDRPPPARRYVVRPGDTLWDLAEGEIGDGATVAAVAAYWPRIHHHNRAVIGADPDLILPGQRLRVPLPPTEREEAP